MSRGDKKKSQQSDLLLGATKRENTTSVWGDIRTTYHGGANFDSRHDEKHKRIRIHAIKNTLGPAVCPLLVYKISYCASHYSASITIGAAVPNQTSSPCHPQSPQQPHSRTVQAGNLLTLLHARHQQRLLRSRRQGVRSSLIRAPTSRVSGPLPCVVNAYWQRAAAAATKFQPPDVGDTGRTVRQKTRGGAQERVKAEGKGETREKESEEGVWAGLRRWTTGRLMARTRHVTETVTPAPPCACLALHAHMPRGSPQRGRRVQRSSLVPHHCGEPLAGSPPGVKTGQPGRS